MEKKTRIEVKHGERQKLAKLLNTTYPAVKRALNGQTTTDLQRRIRKVAIDRGGKEYQFL